MLKVSLHVLPGIVKFCSSPYNAGHVLHCKVASLTCSKTQHSITV
jgi:hypothetical protein